MSVKARIHAVVTGVVQGVGFRYFVIRQARELGLKGWVRNRSDGAVEVTAEGEDGLLRDFARALGRGPASAAVSGVEVTSEPYRGEFNRFELKYD